MYAPLLSLLHHRQPTIAKCLFKWTEGLKVARCEVETVRWMWQNLELEVSICLFCCCRKIGMSTVVVQEKSLRQRHSSSVATAGFRLSDVQHLSNFTHSYPSVFLNNSVSMLGVVFGCATLTGTLIELRQTRWFFRI